MSKDRFQAIPVVHLLDHHEGHFRETRLTLLNEGSVDVSRVVYNGSIIPESVPVRDLTVTVTRDDRGVTWMFPAPFGESMRPVEVTQGQTGFVRMRVPIERALKVRL